MMNETVLVEWVRTANHKHRCYAGMKEVHGVREGIYECTCGLDRIREIVGGE